MFVLRIGAATQWHVCHPLLYLNSVALLRYPDGSLPILEDGSIDPNYIRLTGIPAEELLVLIDNGLLSQVKRRFEVEV